ncbi:MAG: hypothetical protein AMJ59_02260 [Gammaproteobacteria bacterium SG8_31]|jgi:uncharacterized protein YjeT (DUF2065 family)|nr:MAG: hypothetical protein AMJ59_02260 [Gammaproteobacteria bacterium SG8_31]
MDWSDFLSALALVLVIEGIMPFANPAGTRRTMALIAQLGDRPLRTIGLLSMAAGLVLLYIVRF